MFKSNESQNFQQLNSDYFFPSVNRWVKLTGWGLLLTTSIFIALCSVLKYSVTVKGKSLIRPSGGTRLVESQKEGTIKNIAVQKNQLIEKGDIIAILNQSEIEIQKNQLISNIQQKQLKIEQIDSQINFLNQKIIAESESLNQEIIIAQLNLNRILKENQKIKISATASLQEAEVNLELAKQELEIYTQLFNQGIISHLELKEKLAALKIAEARVVNMQSLFNPVEEELRIC